MEYFQLDGVREFSTAQQDQERSKKFDSLVLTFEEKMDKTLRSVKSTVSKTKRFKSKLDRIKLEGFDAQPQPVSGEQSDEDSDKAKNQDFQGGLIDAEKTLRKAENCLSQAVLDLGIADQSLRDAVNELETFKMVSMKDSSTLNSANIKGITSESQHLFNGLLGTFDLFNNGLASTALPVPPILVVRLNHRNKASA